jgi:hypothetical protein
MPNQSPAAAAVVPLSLSQPQWEDPAKRHSVKVRPDGGNPTPKRATRRVNRCAVVATTSRARLPRIGSVGPSVRVFLRRCS